jgi:uncharacterized protein DUF6459
MTAIAPSVLVRPLAESRPPSRSWRAAETSLIAANQPPLDLTPPGDVDLGRPSGEEATLTLVRGKWTVRPRPDLPDARQWGATLTLAVLQALLAQRPIAQLNRWLADDVLSAVTVQQRRCRTEPGRAARPVVLRSVRVQHPGAEVAEVSAHVLVGRDHTAVAFRLEARGDRWLCTAFELDLRALR